MRSLTLATILLGLVFQSFCDKAQSTTRPAVEGDSLIVGEGADAETLNPLFAVTDTSSQVIALLFLQLAKIEPDFSYSPSLARSWEFSDDRLTLTFRLRDNVHWHDGVKTTAHDVKFTFDLHTNPEVNYPSSRWKKHIKECVVDDDTTVRFVFDKSYPTQLSDANVGHTLPRHILGKVPPEKLKNCEFNSRPVGNGPFRLEEWKRQFSIKLKANDEHYAGRPPLDRIIFKIIPSLENRVLQLKSGDIDVLTRVPLEHYQSLVSRPHIQPHILPDRVYYYIGWNLKNPLFKSRKVRQALTMAIDRSRAARALFGEHAEVCNGPISPILWGYDPHLPGLPFDIEKAKRYLADEGWTDSDGDGILDKDGRKFSFELKTSRGNQNKEDTVFYVQDMLKKVGVDVRPKLVEWVSFTQELLRKDFDSVVGAWGVALKMDLTSIWHSKAPKYNFVSFANEEFDRLNDAAILENDREKAKKLWWKAQRIIAEEQPYTFLYFPKQINFVHRRFQDVQMETIGWFYNLPDWWVKKSEQKR